MGCAKSGASSIAEAVLLSGGHISCWFTDASKVRELCCFCGMSNNRIYM